MQVLTTALPPSSPQVMLQRAAIIGTRLSVVQARAFIGQALTSQQKAEGRDF